MLCVEAAPGALLHQMKQGQSLLSGFSHFEYLTTSLNQKGYQFMVLLTPHKRDLAETALQAALRSDGLKDSGKLWISAMPSNHLFSFVQAIYRILNLI